MNPEIGTSLDTIALIRGYGWKPVFFNLAMDIKSFWYHTFTATVNAYEADE